MSVECFLDTNVLVYAVSSSREDAGKKARSLDLIQTKDFGLSSQVLQELYVAVTRKIRKPLHPKDAAALLEQYRLFPIVWTSYALIVSAIETSLRHGISYWDGAIVAAAETLGASVIYTEDLNHGQVYGSVRAVNPYRDV